jgi:preprotein translocase subunit SecD
MGRIKKIFTNLRVILLLVFLLFALWAINPQPWVEGAAIRSVAKESSASVAGIASPTSKIQPLARERVIAINNQPVKNASDYYIAVNAIVELGPNRSFTVQTNKNLYSLITKQIFRNVTLNETEQVNLTTAVFNETTNQTVNVTTQETRNKMIFIPEGVEDVGLTVYDAPTTNIRQGLDLSGGTRVILAPSEPVNASDMTVIVENIKERLNVYGLSDIVVRTAKDLSGSEFIIVEIAGANKDEVRDLIAKQGKFEASIANQTVFNGGDKDVTHVCKSADCSGLDPRRGCGPTSAGQWICYFRFSIGLSPAAAQRQAAITNTLDVKVDQQGNYLSQPLDLYLDDQFVDSLQISADLKGRVTTDIEISGSGVGSTQQEAKDDALNNMKKLQSVMVTGSLPVQLAIVKTDSISPLLGKEFLRNSLLVGVLVIFSVALVVFIRYRDLRISIPMIITMFAETVLILGFAAVSGWNLDLAAIAAIIVAIGTGVDDQIVIADETLFGSRGTSYTLSWKERLGRAFFIIVAAYIATVAAMAPLLFAGAGMLRLFAITTIAGVSFGVFLARPAYAAVIEILHKSEGED